MHDLHSNEVLPHHKIEQEHSVFLPKSVSRVLQAQLDHLTSFAAAAAAAQETSVAHGHARR